ncbi:cytochrome c oxidase assembly protein [Dactylosporangium sucinum]|uniref:ABC transporter permease n=1 Tax=Dactylosporangium sucinum TaxID=1424081 RepID=A0A917UAV5_9ACTN|nr:cytochrome c oxidase assembly protein [Dactylosporangium sucinum]GGM67126.1 ABC transporter permease [Dactylosporangium sucinum]
MTVATPGGDGVRRWLPLAVAAGVVTFGGAAAVLALRGAGGWPSGPLPGITSAGPVTDWGLPLSRVGRTLASSATIGMLMAATVLTPQAPGSCRMLAAVGQRSLRNAGWAAAGWMLATTANAAFTLSDLMAVPTWQALAPATMWEFLTGTSSGRASSVSAATAGVIVVTARVGRSAATGIGLAALAMVGVLAPVFTGHAAAQGSHQIAVSALVLHVGAATVWAGGLAGLLACRHLAPEALARSIRRFSWVAAVCMVAVAASGLISAAVRLPTPSSLLATGYGWLLLGKTTALCALAFVGFLQRARSIPALATGDRRVLVRTTVAEAALFGLTFGLAAGLSRTPPPASFVPEDPAARLLGFPMPGPPTARSLLVDWLPEPLTLTAATVAVALYLAAVWRLWRRGDHWPVARTAMWVSGWVVVIVATSSGLARYAPVLFSAHMIQHMILTMVAPILFVLAAPATVGLRALRPSADPAWAGPREWITAALHSRSARLLTHPAVAFGIYTTSLYGMYLTDLYEIALRSHLGHLVMIAHFLGAGYLFFWVLIGADPSPRPRPAFPFRLVILLIFMAMHAIFGLIMMQTQEVIANDWYSQLGRPWGNGALADQKVGGGIAWASGELPALTVAIALVVQWSRSDARADARYDRSVDRAERSGADNAHAAYNRMLAQLAERDGRPRPTEAAPAGDRQ